MRYARPKSRPLRAACEKSDSIVDDRSRSPAQRAGIHRVRTLLRAEADGGGRLWPCPGARRNLGFSRGAFLRALLFRAEGRERQDRGGDLAHHACADAVQAAGRPRGHRHRQAHHLSRLVEIPDRDRGDRARRHRRADGADGRAQEEARRRGPVRRSAQAIVAVAAGGDRRGDLADRRRDPRHPASACGSLSAPRAGVAGQGAGRRLGRADRRRHSRFQCAARAAAEFRGPIC